MQEVKGIDTHMGTTEFLFSKLHPNKLSISFTWDDNFPRHIESIAPAFEQYNMKCTFYVNPGEPNFVARLATQYAQLSLAGFEIGSHGHTHHHFTKLNERDYMDQLIQSKKAIGLLTQKIPVTFAFPHHDFTEIMLHKARSIYFETRNTLRHTQRYGLKSNTTLNDIDNVLERAILNKNSIVFSGHSVILPSDKNNIDGYEPVPIDCLQNILKKVSSYKTYADVCTFEQASFKEYILNNCSYNNEKFELTQQQSTFLESYGIASDRIEEIV